MGAVAAGGADEVLRRAFGELVGTLAMELHVDERGTLSVVDLDGLPFAVRRLFNVTGGAAGTRRGGHGLARGTQVLFCTAGRIEVLLRSGGEAVTVALGPDGIGLRIEAPVWAEQHYLDASSQLLVLASEPHDPDGYVRSPT